MRERMRCGHLRVLDSPLVGERRGCRWPCMRSSGHKGFSHGSFESPRLITYVEQHSRSDVHNE